MDVLSFDLQLDGTTARVVLANLPWKNVTDLAIDPTTTSAERLPRYLRSNLFRSIASVADELVTRSLLDSLDAASTAFILARRDEVFIQLRGAGRMYAQCPQCHAGEVEMSLLGLFDTLGTLPPPMVSHGYFLPPVASEWHGPPARPAHFSYASKIRFELPTYLVGLPRSGFEGGVLGRTSADRERPLYERWQNDGVNAPLDQTWRSRDRATFQATITLLAATREVVPPGEPTVEVFEELPAVDVYFLDAIYHLAFDTSVPEHAMPRSCPACAQPFIPVAPMVWEAPLP